MAEIAVGGIQAGIKLRRSKSVECAHTDTLSVISAGVERTVCEHCGHLSVHFLTELSGPIERERFARPADGLQLEAPDLPEEPARGGSTVEELFAREERLHVRSRYQSYPVQVPA